MNALHVRALGLRAGFAAATLAGLVGLAEASDHEDTAVLSAEAGYDLTDLFVWQDLGQPPPPLDAGMYPDDGGPVDAGPLPKETYVFMAMTLRGRPVPNTQYIFHLESRSDIRTGGDQGYAVCIFDQALFMKCWVRDMLYVEGDASLGIEHDGLMAWAGFINDPTFGNLGAVRELVDVLSFARTLTSSTSLCPVLSTQERQVMLRKFQDRPVNTFARKEAFVILLRMKAEVAAPGGPLLGVWASVRNPR